jgi:serine/threonine-protein kinase
MGLVYVAEQERPLRRRVALKLIKPGMDSRQVVARFEAERQALALMDHPHIARVHDGGTTPEGRPYFVMELVRGTPITDYCDQQRLGTRARLRLFQDVCAAMQHAHQKGVIHRDLKPSNVLVSVHDVTPVVKVIDFGVAKALGGRLTDKTLYTALAQLVGTPLYMSPEQAGHSDLDVDTRSDVYSLGVLLYELLTGTTPFDSETLKRAGYDEMRRIIREEEPPRPSTRLSTLEQAQLSTIAERRGLEPGRLRHDLRGELDWIVMKALEKDRNRRYESASALAQDIARYLADEPVLACPPSAFYRLRKFVRRHRLGVGVAACMLGLLVLGVGVLWREQARQAAAVASVEAALERAELLREQERWQEAAAVLTVAQAQPEGRGQGALRQRVEQARRDVDMLMSLEEAQVQHSLPGEEQDYDCAGSARMYAQAFERYGLEVGTLRAEEAAMQVRASAIREHLLDALRDWARCREMTQDPGGAGPLRAVARLADDDPWRQRLREAAGRKDRAALEALAEQPDVAGKSSASLRWLAGSLRDAGSSALAERLMRRAQVDRPADFWINVLVAEIYAEGTPKDHVQRIRFWQAAVALRPQSPAILDGLGASLHAAGKLAEAEATLRRALALKPDYARSYMNLGLVLRDEGRLAEAEAAWRQAEAALRQAIALQPQDCRSYTNLAVVLMHENKLAEAEAAARKGVALNPEEYYAQNNLGCALQLVGKPAEAEAACRKALALKPNDAGTLMTLGNALRDQGKVDEAEAAYRRSIALKPDYAEAYANLGDVLTRGRSLREAEAAYRQAIAVNPGFAGAHYNLACLLLKLGKMPEAEEAFRQAIALAPNDPDAYANLGLALLNQGKPKEAEAALRNAIALEPHLSQAHCFHGNALKALGKPKEAEVAYRLAIALQPGYVEAHCKLARVLSQRGAPRNAIAAYREALRLNPAHAVAQNDLAWLLATCPEVKLRDPGQAVRHGRKAVELAPGEGALWNTLGVALYRNGDWKAAVEALGKSVQLRKGGDSADFLFLAMAHWQLQEKDKARAWYEKGATWIEKHQPLDAEMKGFRAEAAALLGLANDAAPAKKQ